jgi:hypothetical protein
MRSYHATVRALFLLLLGSSAAAAQTAPGRPHFELGGQATMLSDGNFQAAAAGPHFTMNFGSRSAVNVAGEWQLNTGDRMNHAMMFRAQLEQSVWQSRQGSIFLAAGMALWRNTWSYPSQTLPSGFTYPAASYTDTTALFVLGGGFTRALAQRLTLRAEAEVLFAFSNPALRFSAGLSVPIGRYHPDVRATRPVAAPPLGSPESRVHPGLRVLVTSIDGRERHGTIQSVSNGIVEVDVDGVVTALQFADIRRIETQGTSPIGKAALVGALAGGIPMGIYMGALCANEGCSGGRVAAFTMGFAAMGAGIGALIGAALASGPHVIYESGRPHTIAVAPVVTGRGLGVGGSIRW